MKNIRMLCHLSLAVLITIIGTGSCSPEDGAQLKAVQNGSTITPGGILRQASKSGGDPQLAVTQNTTNLPKVPPMVFPMGSEIKIMKVPSAFLHNQSDADVKHINREEQNHTSEHVAYEAEDMMKTNYPPTTSTDSDDQEASDKVETTKKIKNATVSVHDSHVKNNGKTHEEDSKLKKNKTQAGHVISSFATRVLPTNPPHTTVASTLNVSETAVLKGNTTKAVISQNASEPSAIMTKTTVQTDTSEKGGMTEGKKTDDHEYTTEMNTEAAKSEQPHSPQSLASDEHAQHSHLSNGKTSVFLQPTESAAILAGAFAAVAVLGYVGLVMWRKFLEKRYGNREMLVNEDDFYDENDLRHFEL